MRQLVTLGGGSLREEGAAQEGEEQGLHSGPFSHACRMVPIPHEIRFRFCIHCRRSAGATSD
jgi:hypothetical protein